MTSPSSSSAATTTNTTGNTLIDGLLGGTRWADVNGLTTLSYSFPWTTLSTAAFLGPDGNSYSSNNEPTATSHFGLNAVQQQAATQALQAWANVAKLSFTLVQESPLDVGDIRFAFSSASSLSNVWGYAAAPNAYWPVAGDIWINATLGSQTTWSAGAYNYEALIHETGHALGLKHPFEGSTVLPTAQDNRLYTLMSYTEAPNSLFIRVTPGSNGSATLSYITVTPDTPMLLDIQAMQSLYGANTSTNSGDDTYTFDPATPFFRTLWDGAGNDTISVSNFSKGCSIDLTPGSFSKITIESDSTAGYNWSTTPKQPTYDGTNALTIAYNCTIENAVGGSGSDTLKGNSADNRLTGGGGNDTLDGGSGSDSAFWTQSRTHYSLTWTATQWQVQDKVGSDGTDTLTNMELLAFSDKTVHIESASHGSYADLPSGLYQFFITAFNAAPGVTYMNQLAEAWRAGMDLQSIVTVFTGKSQFTDIYTSSLSHAALATQLVDNIIKTSASSSARVQAITDITGALDYGWSMGRVVYQVFGNLASKPLTDTDWGNTAHLFANEITLAKCYTETMDQSTTDLATLQSVIASVSAQSDLSSSASQITLVGQALLA